MITFGEYFEEHFDEAIRRVDSSPLNLIIAHGPLGTGTSVFVGAGAKVSGWIYEGFPKEGWQPRIVDVAMLKAGSINVINNAEAVTNLGEVLSWAQTNGKCIVVCMSLKTLSKYSTPLKGMTYLSVECTDIHQSPSISNEVF
ncbi:MAG: hypothetical protein MJA28_05940 [Gammaproteobacteria bacterium]|nr:hypothetical protein [Gammaproteobacteria bacterium]